MTKPGSAEVPSPAALPWVPWLIGALTLLPFAICRTRLAELFWFGDEWDLLDQITRQGLGAWTWTVFAENFVPLFKLGWSGLVLAGGGSYLVMLAALWISHALNVALLGGWLRQAGFGWISSIFTMLIFGLASANLETLTWSVQWSAVLATTFFLGAALWQGGPLQVNGGFRSLGILFALSSASALSFSRGVLTGAALALASLWPTPAGSPAVPWNARLRQAFFCLLPAAAVAAAIAHYATGNQSHLLDNPGTLGRATEYGLWYFALNPAYRLFGCHAWGLTTTIELGALKLAAIGWALAFSRGSVRRLLAVLLLFDLGNAVLLGIGRYHTGLETVISSRYQYASLLCTLPFAGYALERLVASCAPAPARVALASALIVAATWLSARSWADDLRGWAEARGRVTRALIFTDPNPPAMGAVPGIPFMSTARARELAAHYHLH
jgi:hypothetical protein